MCCVRVFRLFRDGISLTLLGSFSIVERNAVVLPDVESFEQNYEDMKQELDYHRCIVRNCDD